MSEVPLYTGPLSPVDPSFRAIPGRLKLTVTRHEFNKDSLPTQVIPAFLKRGDIVVRDEVTPPPIQQTNAILYEKGIKLEFSGNEVYYRACSSLVILKNSCNKPHYQIFKNSIPFLHKIAPLRRPVKGTPIFFHSDSLL